jgi:hypothetical protein
MKFYGDFEKLRLISSDLEQLKVLLKANNFWDRLCFDFDFNRPALIGESSVSIPFTTEGVGEFFLDFLFSETTDFYIKFEKEDRPSLKKGFIKMKASNFFMQTLGWFICRSIRRTVKTNLSKL